MASVTYYSNSYDGRQLSLAISQNKTTINWTLTSAGGNSTYYTIYNTNIVIAGTTVYNPGTVYWNSGNFPAAKGSKSGSITIAKGTKSITTVFQGTVYYSRSDDYGGTLTLDTTYNAPSYTSISASPARTSVTLTGTVSTDGASITGGGWDISTDGGSTWTYYEGGPTSSTITGLTPNTAYSYRGYVITEGGSANSSWSSFTTSGNVPTINNLGVSTSRTSATFSPSVSYDTNASFKSYTIKYGTSTSYGSTSTSTILSGLSPNTTYYYSMTVTDNWSRTSSAKTGSFKTTGNAPTISSHGVKTYGQTSMEMQYLASYDTNDSLSSYKWEYGVSTSYGSSVSGTNIISGLNANTTYYYKLTVTSVQGRSATATGSFKTDPATVTISALGVSEITETTTKVNYTFNNPSGVSPIDRIEIIITKEGEEGLHYTTVNVSVPYVRECTNLESGSKYTYQTRVGTLGQIGTIYYSDWATIEFETLVITPFSKIDADGTVKRYKGYALGKADIYNGYTSEWQNGTYSATAVGTKIVFNSAGAGVAKVRPIEVLPNEKYTFDFPSQTFSGSIMIVETDSNDTVTNTWSMATGGSSICQTKSTTTRIYISYSESSTSTSFVLNEATAKYITFHLYKTAQKVALDKESIVTLNNKIRYIDIKQKGYTKDGTDYTDGKIVELDVYDTSENNISLGKTVTIEKGTGSNPEAVTDGNHSGETYCTLDSSTDATVIRVDLGQEYSYDSISRVVLWRESGTIYKESRLFGLDANKQITWKFQSYKNEGTYEETSEGYTARARKVVTEHEIYISSVLNILDDPPYADKIIINADWMIMYPPVITDLTTHRVDAIIAANSGRMLQTDIGDLTTLTTAEKSNLVAAINELYETMGKGTEDYTILDFVLESIICG